VRELLIASGANGPVFHKAFEKVVGASPLDVRAIDKANQRALDALKIDPA